MNLGLRKLLFGFLLLVASFNASAASVGLYAAQANGYPVGSPVFRTASEACAYIGMTLSGSGIPSDYSVSQSWTCLYNGSPGGNAVYFPPTCSPEQTNVEGTCVNNPPPPTGYCEPPPSPPSSVGLYASQANGYPVGKPVFHSASEACAYIGMTLSGSGIPSDYSVSQSWTCLYNGSPGGNAVYFPPTCSPEQTNVEGTCVNNSPPSPGYCAPPPTSACPSGDAQCQPYKNYGPPPRGSCTANPVNSGTGNKYQAEQDYVIGGISSLRVVRYYNSQSGGADWLGKNWRVFPSVNMVSASTTIINRPDHRTLTFGLLNGVWIADQDVSERLSRLTDSTGATVGWKVTTANDEVETYNADGSLASIRNRLGIGYTVTWNFSGNNTTLVDNWGRTLLLKFGATKLDTITDPAGGVIRYGYDAANNLTTVTYQDGAVRRYHYEESRFPNALTGITDENGTRYATWAYDAQGRAVSSEHGVGADKYSIAYNTTSTVVTDPLGTARTTNFTTVLGVVRSIGQSQPGGAGCGPASSAITYDANGNIASRTDFNGNQTTYSYDLARNLETSRTEAAGTAQARTITTEWHPTYRLPARIAEPKRITTHSYDTAGSLLSKTVQATSDATGAQGFSAAPVGTARTWSYTYNTVGQVLTAAGPRTDVADVTTYAYDSQGNLVAITNAANQVTTLSNYDAHGRAGRIVDANGLVTDLAYSPRGWLTAKTVGGEATGYEYDGVGQLKKVTLPDGSLINYTYDDAHRLTAIADSLGNRIEYTLDAMGNRINEEVRDPTGMLARQTTRIYDALNRLQQITGGVQ